MAEQQLAMQTAASGDVSREMTESLLFVLPYEEDRIAHRSYAR